MTRRYQRHGMETQHPVPVTRHGSFTSDMNQLELRNKEASFFSSPRTKCEPCVHRKEEHKESFSDKSYNWRIKITTVSGKQNLTTTGNGGRSSISCSCVRRETYQRQSQ
jgi:hypothetical protein